MKKAMTWLATLATVATGMATATQASAATSAWEFQPEGVAGRNCFDDDSVHTRVDQGGQRVRWEFDNLLVKNGPKLGGRGSCEARFSISGRKGWSYALRSFRVEGIADVPRNSTAQVQYHVAQVFGKTDATAQVAFRERYLGALPTKVTLDRLVFSPCDGQVDNLALGADLLIRPAEAEPANTYLAIGAIQVTPQDLVWRRCARSAS